MHLFIFKKQKYGYKNIYLSPNVVCYGILSSKNQKLKKLLLAVDSGDFYILYVRDQNGSTTFSKNTQVEILKREGGTTFYSHNHTYTSNKIYRFQFNLYSETDGEGNFNITVDENILQDVEDISVVPAL
jgi:hypothetical protein